MRIVIAACRNIVITAAACYLFDFDLRNSGIEPCCTQFMEETAKRHSEQFEAHSLSSCFRGTASIPLVSTDSLQISKGYCFLRQ